MISIVDLFTRATQDYLTEVIVDEEQEIKKTIAYLDHDLTVVLVNLLGGPLGYVYFKKDFEQGFSVKYGMEKNLLELGENTCENLWIVDDRIYFNFDILINDPLFHDVKQESFSLQRYSAFFDKIDSLQIPVYKYLSGMFLN